MIKNYFKIAWRNLQRNKAYAFISVTGLALGITCSILIFTLISYHLSFDNFHKNPERIFRFYTEWHGDEGIGYSRGVPQPLGKAFKAGFSLGEKTGRAIFFNGTLVSIPGQRDKKFDETVAFTEPEYFDIFNFPLIKGDKKTLLQKPNEALITEKYAKKYFGSDDALGKVIRLNNTMSFTVIGVLKDMPENTDFDENVFLSYASMDAYTNPRRESNWGGVFSGSMAFTKLKPNVTQAQANKALAQIVKQNYKDRDLKEWNFMTQPIADIHFNAELGGNAKKSYLWALFFIGLFLIITACVNFINLATAQALNRSKEIGVRKVLGSQPKQLFWQFIAETAIITLVGTVIAIGLAMICLPLVNDLFRSRMRFNWPLLSAFVSAITIIVVFLSGSYPGLVLARFQPIAALKNKISQEHVGGFSLRRVLVVVQFSISQMLIIGAIIVISQLRYSKNTNLGFDKDAIVTLPLPGDDLPKKRALRNQINEVPGVEKITMCYSAPAANSNNSTGVNFDNRAEDEHWGINVKSGDENYVSTFGLKIVAGKNLSPSDTIREFLVNESFVKKLGLKNQDVINKKLSINGRSTSGLIVGVVNDFYNYSFHNAIDQVCISTDAGSYDNIAIKINMKNVKSSLASFEKIWNKAYPDDLYAYNFVDDMIARFYENDATLLTLIEAFAIIAIVIGCLGLYGLVSFMAVRKNKEVGVRKVLGASIQSILWLFGKEFCRLLVIAFLIAAPIAWWVMNNYLKDFTYKITIGPSIFLISIASTFIIAGITVGYRATLAAIANPVKSLRSE